MILSCDDQKLWELVDVCGPDHCWEYQGPINKHTGYGGIYYQKKMEGAHRAAWMSWNCSAVPSGMLVLHSCDNRKCCNPNHLRVGTYKDNVADAVGRKRLWMQNVTHCPRGHEYSEKNTMYSKLGKRDCRECNKLHYKKRAQKPEWASEKRRRAREKYALQNPSAKPRLYARKDAAVV